MSITREQAINNLTVAKLKCQVDWALYIDTNIAMGHKEHVRSKIKFYTMQEAYEEHVRSETKFYTMQEAYIACGVLTWDDTQSIRKYAINAA